jgi:stage II sporulation protein AA (anti-sigma F factor antagonist)
LRFQIELEQHRKALIVRLKGELDHHTAEMLKARMEDAIGRDGTLNVVLSLKELSFMDSSGLGVILGRYRQIAAKGGKMVVCDVAPHLVRLFEMSGLFKIIAMAPSEQAALAGLEVAL